MPYAVYSKRTGIITRIVDDLDSLLDSESILEIDEDTNFQREYSTLIEGQNINSVGFPLFIDTNGFTTFKPQRREFDANDRPYPVKNNPIYVAPLDFNDNPVTQYNDLSIAVHPFAWTVSSAAAVKYEAILARNAPFNIVIGEEFINDDHIDTGGSSGYVLSEGQLWLKPGGVFESSTYSFRQSKAGGMDMSGASEDRDARQYVFDTYWFSPEPEDVPEGMDFYWQGTTWAGGTILGGGDTFYPMVLNDSAPTTATGASAATVLSGIKIKIINRTSVTLNLENYLLMLQIRNLPSA